MSDFLNGLQFYFVTKRLGKVQHQILVDKIEKFGGLVNKEVSEDTTHVLFPRGVNFIENGLDAHQLQLLPSSVLFVSIDWLPMCIAQRKLIQVAAFEVTYNI